MYRCGGVFSADKPAVIECLVIGNDGLGKVGLVARPAIQIAAICQLRYNSEGRTYYDRKIAEGKTSKEAIRALKRRISDRVYRHLIEDHRRVNS